MAKVEGALGIYRTNFSGADIMGPLGGQDTPIPI